MTAPNGQPGYFRCRIAMLGRFGIGRLHEEHSQFSTLVEQAQAEHAKPSTIFLASAPRTRKFGSG